MMLTQYLSCFEKLRADNVEQNVGYWYWVIDGERSNIKTIMPKKLKKNSMAMKKIITCRNQQKLKLNSLICCFQF